MPLRPPAGDAPESMSSNVHRFFDLYSTGQIFRNFNQEFNCRNFTDYKLQAPTMINWSRANKGLWRYFG